MGNNNNRTLSKFSLTYETSNEIKLNEKHENVRKYKMAYHKQIEI